MPMDYISTKEAAGRRGCSRQAIVDALNAGRLNGIRVGRVFLVADDAVLANFVARRPSDRVGLPMNLSEDERARRAEHARTLAARRKSKFKPLDE
jgi:excisionase family DNA binding protein